MPDAGAPDRSELQPGTFAGLHSARVVCSGVSWWNRKAVRALLEGLGALPDFTNTLDDGIVLARQRGCQLVAWASKLTPELEERAAHELDGLIRIEDGFVRSVGLGAGLMGGASYALDSRGIHYNATRPSDVEVMLQSVNLSPAEIERGQRIRCLILEHGLTKYNLKGRITSLPPRGGRQRILVPGQVAGDAAIARTLCNTIDVGAANINLELLRAVRGRNPQAFIIYKPHPDVAAGLRSGRIPNEAAQLYADKIEGDADILSLIEQTDSVETLSSLAGFEALLRGKPVTVHGTPFYAGWGLTTDLTRMSRRTRRRSLDELVYVALVLYCRHLDPITLSPVSCEELVERLAELGKRRTSRLAAEFKTRLSWLGRKLGL